MEVLLWTRVLQGSGHSDCLVMVEVLDDGDHEWRVARTLGWLHQGRIAVCLCNPNPFPVQLPQGRPLAAVVQVSPEDVQGRREMVLTSPRPTVVEVAVQSVRAGEADEHPALALQGEGLTQDQQNRLTALLRKWATVPTRMILGEQALYYTKYPPAVHHLYGSATVQSYRVCTPNCAPSCKACWTVGL